MTQSLITGGAGFIGSHLAARLLDAGHRVVVVDDYSTGNRDNLAAIGDHPSLEMIDGSVTDDALVTRLVDAADRVYHLAAAVGVALIAKAPIQTIERNVYPTQLILDRLGRRAAAGDPVPCFIASTSEVYGKNPKPSWSEEDDLVFGSTTRPRWSYGVSKAIDEFLALAYHKGERIAGRGGTVLQRRRPAANRRLWHGPATVRLRRPRRRAPGGSR